MTTHEVTFRPNPMQKSFITSKAKADLFSSRMGEGKSAALSWACFYHTQHNPGANWVIARDTWENLRATTQREFFKWFPPGIFGTWHETRKVFKWSVSGMGNGEVQFLGMDDPTDASKLQSRELAGFGIDDPAPAAESGGVAEMIFDVAMSRLRQPGMNWYCAKLAENNPDETHWTYRRFVDPGTRGFKCWQPDDPENIKNLPPAYYEDLRHIWAHRPDMLARFVEGEFGFQQQGKQVTPQWADRIHLATGLGPLKGSPLYMLWDFGLNPTCIITQITPTGNWHILWSAVGDGIGVEELIEDVVRPELARRFRGFNWSHIGDPAGSQREQSSSKRTAVRILTRLLKGGWRSGPVRPKDRFPALHAALSRTIHGRGVVLVDRENAKEVWHALRGGWHYKVARTGLISTEPVKDIHSHPGDAMSYGAAILFPAGELRKRRPGRRPEQAHFFGSGGDKLLHGDHRVLPKEVQTIRAPNAPWTTNTE